MPNKKKLVLRIDDDLHARLKLALAYDGLSQNNLIKYIIAAYLAEDKNIRSFIEETVQTILSKRSIKNRKKDKQEKEETIKNFALNEAEIENIFDLIESENEDL